MFLTTKTYKQKKTLKIASEEYLKRIVGSTKDKTVSWEFNSDIHFFTFDTRADIAFNNYFVV